MTAGTTVNANDVMMTIQPENKAYVLQFSVTENQAKKVRVGDTAEILNNWYGNDVSASRVSHPQRSTEPLQQYDHM